MTPESRTKGQARWGCVSSCVESTRPARPATQAVLPAYRPPSRSPHQRPSADDESARVANPHQTPHTTHKAACTYYPSGAVGADLLHYGQREHLARCFRQATIYTFAKTPESVADKTVRRDPHGDLWRDWSEHVFSTRSEFDGATRTE